MTGYVRVDTSNNIADGNVISAADLDNEFDGVQAGFNASTGHTHGGSAGEGAPITKLGPTQDVTASASLLAPKTTNTVDVGSSTLKFKDLWLAGNASVAGTTTLSSALTYGGVTLNNAVTGTGNMVLSTSPTLVTPALGTPASGVVTNLTGTASININGTVGATTASTGAFTTLTTSSTVTLNGGTANGVTYLNGSKVLTSGSALTFDGASLATPNLLVNGYNGIALKNDVAGSYLTYNYNSGRTNAADNIWFNGITTELMRLTSTGLGIGTSSPGAKLTVAAAEAIRMVNAAPYLSFYNAAQSTRFGYIQHNGTNLALVNEQAGSLEIYTNNTLKATLNSSGNLGIGTSSPGAKLDVNGQIRAAFASGFQVDSAGSMLGKLYYSGGLILDRAAATTFYIALEGSPQVTLSAAGNLGLGVTPSAWGSGIKALQMGAYGVLAQATNVFNIGNNYYNNGTSSLYINAAYATLYQQATGEHKFFTAPSGTAGAAITFTQAMTLDASGNLGIGTSSPGYKLQVSSGATAATAYFSSTAVAAYSAAGYNGGNAKLAMVGGAASGATTGINFSQGGLFEAYFGGVQESGGAAAFVWQGYNGAAYAERMRLDASGNLGIGTSSPNFSVGSGIEIERASATATLRLQRATGNPSSAELRADADLVSLIATSNTPLLFGTNATERARIDAAGNLGLGVTPSAWGSAFKAIQVKGAVFSAFGDRDSYQGTNWYYTAGGSYAYQTTGFATQYVQDVGKHLWFTAPSGTAGAAITFTQAMTLDASGNLLVGTTSNTGPGRICMQFPGSTTNGISMLDSTDTTGAAYLAFRNTVGNAVGTITRNGASSVAYNTSSDYRLKNITGPITTSGAYIDSLNPVEGTWKADGSTFVGLIAHEAQEVSRTQVATGTKDGEEMQGMSYSSSEMIANMIAELKALRARVAALEAA